MVVKVHVEDLQGVLGAGRQGIEAGWRDGSVACEVRESVEVR